MKTDKTKLCRIDYVALHALTMQNALTSVANSAEGETQIAPSTEGNLPLPITKEVKSIKNIYVEKDLDVVSVIQYLNEKAKKHFKALPKPIERLVKARYQEGYKLDDFKKVIDWKVKEWLNDAHWQRYLRPSTLYNVTSFENYLEGTRAPKTLDQDFNKGYT